MGEFVDPFISLILSEIFFPRHESKDRSHWLQEARDLSEHRLRIQDMLQDAGADHHVEDA